MGLNFHILRASGRLEPYIKDIEKACRGAERKIIAKIPISNVDVVIADNPYMAIAEIGIGGHTYTPNFIIVSLDTEFADLKKNLQLELLDTFAHECHHAVRWQTEGYGETLFEGIISEGLADHFANEITERKDLHLWDKALKSQQIKEWLTKAEKEFDNKKYSQYDWFFGSKERGIPKWTAYSLGFYLVGNYLKKHPLMAPSTLYKIKAKEFMKKVYKK